MTSLHHPPARGAWIARALPLALLPLVALTAARPAQACGGLFCSSVQSTPVDQTAERILFEVNDDGTVTATVEVSYTGDPREFSWIVPVPEAPIEMGVTSASLLRLLDQASAPTFIPPSTFCSDRGGGLGVGCGADLAPVPAAGGERLADVGGEGEGEVQVEELPRVGPFDDIVVVDSDDPEALVEWLTQNEYLVTDPMKPLIAEYAAEGQKFLALKLAPDAGIEDIVPLRFTCPAVSPHIPLRLTGLAAVPEMSIVVFIAGDARYAPINYRTVEIPTGDVRFDPRNGQFNYFALVSSRLDEEGGLAFVTERATSSAVVRQRAANVLLGVEDEQAARAELDALLLRRPFLTRLYTRMNPEEMIEDPAFERGGGREVPGVHDLSDRSIDVCGAAPPPRVCGDVYCGAGAECADTDFGPGCLCPEGQVGRRITLAGRDVVTCQTTDTDYLSSVLTGEADPCAGRSCGPGGRCVAVNGAPTCACAPGMAAVADPEALAPAVTCVDVNARFGPEELLWPEPEDAPSGTRFSNGDSGCASTARRPASSLFSLALTFLAVLGFARVLRKRSSR